LCGIKNNADVWAEVKIRGVNKTKNIFFELKIKTYICRIIALNLMKNRMLGNGEI